METLALLKQLIEKPSVTPDDQGCQQLIADRLRAASFHPTHLRFEDVDNLWVTHGEGAPLLVFAGHTDVVPPGPLDAWSTDPFTPIEKDGVLYGRGAADMKSGLAAMVVACETFVKENPDHKGTVAMLITSNEEGDPRHGTQKVVKHLLAQNVKMDYCIVGEASSENTFCDTVKHGRRGSLNGELTIHGKQGHAAYPQLADNPIHKSFAALNELVNTAWDKGSADFPPTSLQISNIHAGTGVNNVIPSELTVIFNLRFSTAVTADELKQRIRAIFDKHNLKYDISWQLSGEPFLTPVGTLKETVNDAITQIIGNPPVFSTTGGTSDGRFIAPAGAEVVEIGPINESIHKANEHVDIHCLDPLMHIYKSICERILR